MKYSIINERNIGIARREIDKLFNAGKLVAVVAKDDSFNRMVLENNRVRVLIFNEINTNHKILKQRYSGLNHILCRLASDNSIAIGIDFNYISRIRGKLLAEYLGALMQNIKLCSKHKVKMVVLNTDKKNPQSIFSFLLSLGMPTKMAMESVKDTIN